MNAVVSTPMPQYQCHKKVWALKIVSIAEKSVKTPIALEDIHRAGDVIVEIDSQGDATIQQMGAILIVEAPFSPIEVDADFVMRHKPVAGGYYVVYDNDYRSFSPSKAFEDGYALIPPGMAVPKPCCLRFYSEQVAAALC